MKFPGLKWHEFDWKKYISKDIRASDGTDPVTRFGIHIVRSVEIGVNRTVPDNRLVVNPVNKSSKKQD